MGHVHPNLVGSARFQTAFDQACDGDFILRTKSLLNLPVGDCMASTCFQDRDLLAVCC